MPKKEESGGRKFQRIVFTGRGIQEIKSEGFCGVGTTTGGMDMRQNQSQFYNFPTESKTLMQW